MPKKIFFIKRATFNCFTRVLILLLPAVALMSFNPNNSHTQILIHTGEGDKDSSKGFRKLLGNGLNDNGATILFEFNPGILPFTNAYLLKQGGNLEKMKLWGQPYFMIYERIFSAHALPAALKYLSVVESNLQAGSVSVAGASGPWQLMPAEAKRFGLKVSPGYDERTNFSKSTEAAAKLLTELYAEYNDWLLVIAAYNCGKGGVNRAITKSHSRNFFELQVYLPEETRNHVKKYIATHYFFEGGGGWTTITAAETLEKKEALAYLKNQRDSAYIANTASFEITGKYNSVVASNTLLMDIRHFNKLNPYFDKTLSEGKSYTLRLPQEKAELFKNKRQQILYESVQLFLSGATAHPIAVTAAK